MICEKSGKRIEEAAAIEKNSAIHRHGKFHSPHEAWAVLKEEVEEMCQSVNQGAFQSLQFVLWQDVKHDKAADQAKLDEIYEKSFACACECVQVMAMCLKWGESFDKHPDSV